MDTLDALVEQHVKEAQLRLQRVDEMMAQARAASAEPGGAIDDRLLASVEAHGRALRDALDALGRTAPSERAEAVAHGRGLRAALEVAGLELEKALAAVIQRRR